MFRTLDNNAHTYALKTWQDGREGISHYGPEPDATRHGGLLVQEIAPNFLGLSRGCCITVFQWANRNVSSRNSYR